MFYWGVKIHNVRVQEGKCANCGTWGQGFKAPDGKILCSDCLKKLWDMRPTDLR